MIHVIIKVPGRDSELVVLQDDEVVLLGRAPDEQRLTEPLVPRRPIRPVPIAGHSVSANHALLWTEDGGVVVRDVGSRNGTWIKLPQGGTIRVGDESPLTIQLAGGESAEAREGEPREATWSGRDDFAPSVARAVDDWLRRQDLPVRLRIASRAGQGGGNPGSIPLADGRYLELEPERTMEERWVAALNRIWEFVVRQNGLFQAEEEMREEGLILVSPRIRRVHLQVVEAARRGARVILLGPSGAGKEGLARCYHRHGGRSGAFVSMNCSTFKREFLEKDLFGAEKGAYTGCDRRYLGAVERAHNGTLFLDEIGEMPLELQAMLLRFLDSGEYRRMGSDGQVLRADVRVVCATNRDLRTAAVKGEFRTDLWYRLAGQVVEVPPLRERSEDIVAYLQMRRLTGGLSAHEALGPEALDLLLKHSWDGNFRELANFVDRLPEPVPPGGIDARACERALAGGALVLQMRPSPPALREAGEGERPDWAQLALLAMEAFSEDHRAPPGTWDEIKEYIEKYLKPLLFVHLGGAESVAGEVDVRALADRVCADRGTVRNQLARYRERFMKPTPR